MDCVTLCHRFYVAKRQAPDVRSGRVFFHAGEAVDNSSSESRNRIAFGDFCFSPSERVLERAGQPVRLGGRAMDILIALVEQAGQVVSQRELFARIWPDQAVDASILRVHITTLRKVLLWTPAETILTSTDQFDDIAAPYEELGFDEFVLHHPAQSGPYGGSVHVFEQIAARQRQAGA